MNPELDKVSQIASKSFFPIELDGISMSKTESAEEIRKERLAVLGADLGSVYHALCEEVTWINAKWLEYRKLYGHSPERIKLLNSTAAFFFRVIQDVLSEDILLHLARLTDSPETFGNRKKQNLTLANLPQMIPDAQVSANVKRLADEACSACSFAKDWRNRRLAHRDLNLAIDAAAKPLPPANRKLIGEALIAFGKVLNAVELHYFDGEVMYERFLTTEDADALVYYLRVAAKASDLLENRLRYGGSVTAEDLEPSPEGPATG